MTKWERDKLCLSEWKHNCVYWYESEIGQLHHLREKDKKTVHLTVVKAKSSSSFSLWTGLFFWKSMLQSNKQQSLKKSAYKISLHINPFYFPHYDANAKQRACMSRPLFFSFQSFKNSETETWISHWLLWPVSAFSICQVLTV